VFGTTVVTVVDLARDLGVIIDSQQSMDVHVAALCRSGYGNWTTRGLADAAKRTKTKRQIPLR